MTCGFNDILSLDEQQCKELDIYAMNQAVEVIVVLQRVYVMSKLSREKKNAAAAKHLVSVYIFRDYDADVIC